MAAYVIYQAEILDPEAYEEYKLRVTPSIAAAGGRYLVRGGDAVALEGDLAAGRTVVVEFPTKKAALDWYRGEDYSEIRRLREKPPERLFTSWTASTEPAPDPA